MGLISSCIFLIISRRKGGSDTLGIGGRGLWRGRRGLIQWPSSLPARRSSPGAGNPSLRTMDGVSWKMGLDQLFWLLADVYHWFSCWLRLQLHCGSNVNENILRKILMFLYDVFLVIKPTKVWRYCNKQHSHPSLNVQNGDDQSYVENFFFLNKKKHG